LPCMYSLPWLDGRRSIVPPEAARGVDVPRASVAALALVENASRSYHDLRCFTIQTAGCPDLTQHPTIWRLIARHLARSEAHSTLGHAIEWADYSWPSV
jgi:hypothetical protein